jgi:hypothetical protein
LEIKWLKWGEYTVKIEDNNNRTLTNYGQNAYFWTFWTFSYRGKSKNDTKSVSANRQESKNRKLNGKDIYYFLKIEILFFKYIYSKIEIFFLKID